MLSRSIKVILGIILAVVGLWMIVIWWGDVLSLIRGGLGFAFILAGLACFALLD